jgi:alpha-glucosidase (family GH31 glycosyl hydrolase)
VVAGAGAATNMSFAPMLAFLALIALPGFDLVEHEKPRVLRLADTSLSAAPHTIVEVVNPRSAGGRHDFSSEGDYWWPDPANPNGPYVRRDGQTNPENFVAHRRLLFTFARDFSNLAAAWQITRDERYASVAARHLRAWFVDPATRMSPNLRYAQAIKGVTDGRGVGIIDTVHLAEVARGIAALRGSAAYPADLDQAVTDWFRTYLAWLRTHPNGIEERDADNNHGTCWLLQASAFARLVGDEAALSEFRGRFKEKILPQMATDGSFPRETARTKPYAYSIFNLDVMSAVAVVLSTPQEDLLQFTLPDGRSVIRGVSWLAPYFAQKAKWPLKPDVMAWEHWPVRQPALLFAAAATGNEAWLQLWKTLEADPKDEEVLRNFPIRHPVLWLAQATQAKEPKRGLTTAKATAVASTASKTAFRWVQVAPGVWKGSVGQPEEFTLRSSAGVKPRLQGLEALPAAPFPLDEGEIEAQQWAWKTAVRLPLAREEEIYGLGVDFKTVRRTGQTFQLHVDHWAGVPGRTHAPVPYYVSSRGYGVFFDTARYLNVTVGLGVRAASADKPPVIDRTTNRAWTSLPRSDSIEVQVNAPGLDVYVFAGPTPLEAVRRYNLFNGGGALPPKWGLGFLARTPTRYSAEQALNEIAEFRRNGIPLDMLGLEPGWHDQAYPCSFEWDAKRFPDPVAFLTDVEKQHVRVNLWFNPYVSPTAPLHEALKPYAGTHLVWNGIVPDYSIAEARDLFRKHLHDEVVKLRPRAIGGFKIDEVDGHDRYLWPESATFPSGRDGEQLRQTYGLLAQRAVWDLFREQNVRTLGQVRGTNGGASPFPFVIYNDNYAFDEYITAVVNSGFAGVLWSPEVRGGKGEDMLRRTQAVCFSPLALFNGWATNDKLWTHAEVKDAIRDVIVLRMRLLPYLYTTYAQYHYDGTPLVRPLQLLPGFGETMKTAGADVAGKLDATTNPYAIGKVNEVKDQYLLGDVLLVAPIAPGETSRAVVLPQGRWYDFYTGKYAGENETIRVTPGLEQIPLFVKDGGLVPMIEARMWAPSAEEVLPLEVRHYGEKDGALRLYDDDGETFAYERGEYSWTKLEVKRGTNGEWVTSVTQESGGTPWRYRDVTWRFMTGR